MNELMNERIKRIVFADHVSRFKYSIVNIQ